MLRKQLKILNNVSGLLLELIGQSPLLTLIENRCTNTVACLSRIVQYLDQCQLQEDDNM